MKIAFALALGLAVSPASLAAADDAAPESLLFHHICRSAYAQPACRCALPLLASRIANAELNAELRAHGGAFFARSPKAPLVVAMIDICAARVAAAEAQD